MREIKYLESQGVLNMKEEKLGQVWPARHSRTNPAPKVEPRARPGQQITGPDWSITSHSEKTEYRSSFRAVLKDVAVKNRSKFRKFDFLDINLQQFLAHEKNAKNYVFKKEIPAAGLLKAMSSAPILNFKTPYRF